MPPALSHGNKRILREGASCRCSTLRTLGLAHHQRAPPIVLAYISAEADARGAVRAAVLVTSCANPA